MNLAQVNEWEKLNLVPERRALLGEGQSEVEEYASSAQDDKHYQYRNPSGGLGHGSVSKVPVIQTQGLDSGSQNLCK